MAATLISRPYLNSSAIHTRNLRSETLILSTSVKFTPRNRDLRPKTLILRTSAFPSRRSYYYSSNHRLLSTANVNCVAKTSDPSGTSADFMDLKGNLQKKNSGKTPSLNAVKNIALYTIPMMILMGILWKAILFMCNNNLSDFTLYVVNALRGTSIALLVCQLDQWKTNVITERTKVDIFGSYKLLALNKYLSVGLCLVGLGALSLVCGNAGIHIAEVLGGLLTAYTIKDILYNYYWSPRRSDLYSVGDTIRICVKEKELEGQVIKMGYTMIELLTSEKPYMIPYTAFVGKTTWNLSKKSHTLVNKFKVPNVGIDKIFKIRDDLKSMLQSKTYTKDPKCYIPEIGKSYFEVTLECRVFYSCGRIKERGHRCRSKH